MKEWTVEEFQNPPACYRGAPFWAWNNKLDKEQLVRQIRYFKEMGMGGFHIHCRVGLDTEYLGEEFLEAVETCEQEGERQGLYTYLYDEDRWPSGAAGGIVTKEKSYRSRYLTFVPDKMNEDEDRRLLARYEIVLEQGYLVDYRKLNSGEQGQNVWNLYLEIAKPTPWHNNQTYVDTLNKKAIERFIEVTHETYYKRLGEKFGTYIPSIFTDEPQFPRKETLDYTEEKKEIHLPYTEGFEGFYFKRFGEDFFDHFPEIIWELPNGKISSARYCYHEGISELFTQAFADTVGEWCEHHHLKLTGHMMEEPTLLSQTSALGEAMRSYRGFQLPGIDMLCDWREYTTAKQAQSAAHQFGRSGVTSEIYGVTNWDFDFRGHKLQGDWQAALGVTQRVPHLAWVSMEGEAKRDYPASIFYQSPWYKEYSYIEDHFARVNTALTRGTPVVHVGVVHPVESYWIHFGPKEQTADIRDVLEEKFQKMTEWLLFSMIDFDFLAESLLPEQQIHCHDSRLEVGPMKYDVVLVPGCDTLRSTTLNILERFVKEGGKVIFAGEVPRYLDARPSTKVEEFAKYCTIVPMSRTDIIKELEDFREVEVRRSDGKRAEQFIYQMREDGEKRWVFIANGRKPRNQDLPERIRYQIQIKGSWNIVILDTVNGEIYSCDSVVKNGRTFFERILDLHDSLLLCLLPLEISQEKYFGCLKPENVHRISQSVLDDGQAGQLQKNFVRKPIQKWVEPQSFKLEEENVLLLDQCEYRIDEEDWQETDEILQIDNALRERFGYPKRMEAWPQPWVQKKETSMSHTISMRFQIKSEIDCECVYLALENVQKAKVYWNGIILDKSVCGWFVDESIRKIPLGKLRRGENILVVSYPWGERTNLEWMYILGNFGVRTAGRESWIIDMPENLCFGDYTVQGLPFYTGNLHYTVCIETGEGEYGIQISNYRAPLLKVSVDGGEWKRLVYAPYEISLGTLSAGKHRIDILCYGNRFNAFGTIHCCDETAEWIGSNEWRTEGERYAYEYQLKRAGIMKTPVIYRINNNENKGEHR